MDKYTHWCITERDEVYVLDALSKAYERVHVPLEHVVLEHRDIPELSMRAVRQMGFPL